MSKIELNHNNGEPITTVGELKQVLEPFTDECELNAIRVMYENLPPDNARLQIKLYEGSDDD